MDKGNALGLSVLAKALVFCLLLFPAPAALSANPDEYTLKLVFLYNFTKFINWNNETELNANDPFLICVMGTLPSKEPLIVLESKQSKNRPISTRSSKEVTDHRGCHILFITKSIQGKELSSILSRPMKDTIVVGETENFAEHQGDIGFIIDSQQRVRLEINLGNTQHKNVSIRAPLLEIASKIYRTEGQG
ncbi:MAG: YfiR family protein [Pseudomonadota bacterium]|nr:YfiR family protein [Pseudomonadota bacterium]